MSFIVASSKIASCESHASAFLPISSSSEGPSDSGSFGLISSGLVDSGQDDNDDSVFLSSWFPLTSTSCFRAQVLQCLRRPFEVRIVPLSLGMCILDIHIALRFVDVSCSYEQLLDSLCLMIDDGDVYHTIDGAHYAPSWFCVAS